MKDELVITHDFSAFAQKFFKKNSAYSFHFFIPDFANGSFPARFVEKSRVAHYLNQNSLSCTLEAYGLTKFRFKSIWQTCIRSRSHA